MPIQKYKGRELQAKGLPLIARIYKGEPKGVNKFPRDLNHFRVEFIESPVYDVAKAREAFERLYGATPSVLHNVQLTADNPNAVFTSAMEEWSISKKGNATCLTRCDGVTISQHFDGERTIYEPRPCLNQCACKQVGRLVFWLPEFTRESGILGQFMLVTHSINDIQNIQASIDFASQNIGRLTGVSFVLYRKETPLKSPDGQPVKKSLVYFELGTASAQKLALQASEAHLALPTPTPQIEAPKVVTPEFITAPSEFETELTPLVSVAVNKRGEILYRMKSVNGEVFNISKELLNDVLPDYEFSLAEGETSHRYEIAGVNRFNAYVVDGEITELDPFIDFGG